MPLQAGIMVDASWSDWGIDPDSGDWDASVGSRIFHHDYAGTDGTAYLGPGWGGQYFDVEAIYARHRGDAVDFAIVTGFDPDGVHYGGHLYTAGDVFFDTGGGFDVAMELSSGDLYTGVVGTSPMYASSGPFTIGAGTRLGPGALAVTSDGVATAFSSGDTSSIHYLIEGTLDLAALGAAGSDVGIHWTMSCGNDVGMGRISPVPEPGTLALFGLGAGLAALGARRRRRLA